MTDIQYFVMACLCLLNVSIILFIYAMYRNRLQQLETLQQQLINIHHQLANVPVPKSLVQPDVASMV